MSMFEITADGKVWRTIASSYDHALTLVMLGEARLVSDEAVGVDIQRLPDCKCGICQEHGYPWACHHAEPEDDVHELSRHDRCWE